MDRPPLIVVFGAAVRPDGTPSPALSRRIRQGAAAAVAFPESLVLCSGGAGRAGPSEAAVMAVELRRLGVAQARLVLDEASLDTLQNAAAAARAARRAGAPFVIACSDGYHLPRVRLLLGVLGSSSRAGPRPKPGSGPESGPEPGVTRASTFHQFAMGLREAVAIPYDVALAVMHRRRLLS